MHTYYAYFYVRIIQAMGAYGFRGFYERKPHFLQSVPYALKNIRWLLHNVELPVSLPTLADAFRSMLGWEKLLHLNSGTEAEKPQEKGVGEAPGSPLTVHIFSFSFHRGGVPKD